MFNKIHFGVSERSSKQFQSLLDDNGNDSSTQAFFKSYTLKCSCVPPPLEEQ